MFKKYIKYLWMLIAIPFALALASCNFINIGGNSEASGLDSESWNQVIDNFDTINYSYFYFCSNSSTNIYYQTCRKRSTFRSLRYHSK